MKIREARLLAADHVMLEMVEKKASTKKKQEEMAKIVNDGDTSYWAQKNYTILQDACKENRRRINHLNRMSSKLINKTRFDDQEIADVFKPVGNPFFWCRRGGVLWTQIIEHNGVYNRLHLEARDLYLTRKTVRRKMDAPVGTERGIIEPLAPIGKNSWGRIPSSEISPAMLGIVWDDIIKPSDCVERLDYRKVFWKNENSARAHECFDYGARGHSYIYAMGYRTNEYLRIVVGNSSRYSVRCYQVTTPIVRIKERGRWQDRLYFNNAKVGNSMRHMDFSNAWGCPGQMRVYSHRFEGVAWKWLNECVEHTVSPRGMKFKPKTPARGYIISR